MVEKIPACSPKLYGKELEYVADCLASGWVSGNGKFCKRLEEEFAKYVGAKYAVACSSGTSAVHLSLLGAGIGKGDEVIVPALAPVFSINPIIWCGAKPVLVDIDKDDWNIDVSRIEKKITKKTKAIMPIDLYGMPAKLREISALAHDYKLRVIEDCAEAIGAERDGNIAGSQADLGIFSLYANKAIFAGEGGLVTTNDEKMAQRMRFLRNQARVGTTHFEHPEIGYNYRLADVLAAIACAQLEHVNESVDARIKNAGIYRSLLKDVNGIVLQPEYSNVKNSYWMFTLLVENRDEIIRRLAEKDIETRAAFWPINKQQCYGAMFAGKSYPIAEYVSSVGMNLPSSNDLTEEQIKLVCDSLIEAMKK